jgi:alkylhydroperoxidase family enzyme
MPRVREIEEPGDDPILTDLYGKEQETFGFVLNTSKVMAHRPGILRAAKQLGAAVDRSGLLSPELRALVYLRVALINGCPF